MTKNLEIRTVEHKGIKMRIKIDYDKAEGSILDFQNENKNFVFANRGLEYMNGWLNINDAIKFAIQEIKKELEWCLAESSKFINKKIELTPQIKFKQKTNENNNNIYADSHDIIRGYITRDLYS